MIVRFAVMLMIIGLLMHQLGYILIMESLMFFMREWLKRKEELKAKNLPFIGLKAEIELVFYM